MFYILLFVGGQVFAIVTVVSILRVILNRMLIDLSIRHIECQKLSDAHSIADLRVISHKPLNDKNRARFVSAASKVLLPGKSVAFEIDPALKGGAIIHIGNQVIDCSLKDRLQQAIRMR